MTAVCRCDWEECGRRSPLVPTKPQACGQATAVMASQPACCHRRRRPATQLRGSGDWTRDGDSNRIVVCRPGGAPGRERGYAPRVLLGSRNAWVVPNGSSQRIDSGRAVPYRIHLWGRVGGPSRSSDLWAVMRLIVSVLSADGSPFCAFVDARSNSTTAAATAH